MGTVGHVEGFAGLVAADEPRAVFAARDILSAGGSAADAATTLYFTLAVTLPSTASLGGGGACVAYDRNKSAAEVVEFPGLGVGEAATPANPRGFYLLQTRYGKLRWEALLAEPERLAREGVPVSRALAFDLATAAPRLAEDAEARRLFFRPDGRVLGEGDRMLNLDLAAVLSGLRRAPGDFYAGQSARALVAAAQQAGLGLTLDALNATRPTIGAGATLALGNDVAMLPSAGAFAARDAESQIKGGGHPAPAKAPGVRAAGTGFVVLDSYGGAVACAVSPNGLFGSGRVLPGSGYVLAAAPTGGEPAALPTVVFNSNSHEAHFAGAAAGGDPALALSTAMVLAVAQDKGAGDAVAAASAKSGENGRIEALACHTGSPDAGRCSVATDPKGFGYARVVGK